MPKLSAPDIALLSSELPSLIRIEIASDLYESGRGYIEYRASGPSDGPVLLMLHGIGSSSAGYRAQLAGLGDKFRVLAWNAPGYGASDPFASPAPDVKQYARALSLFLAALGIRRVAALVGSSWGSVIAIAFAQAYPEQLATLVLSAPNLARGEMQASAREAELAMLIAAGDGSKPVDRDAIADRLLTPDTPEQVRAIVARLRDTVTPVGWAQAAHMLFTVHTPALIGLIECPIVMMVGSQDRQAPMDKHAEPLCRVAPAIQLHLFEGYGHMLKLEAPAKFNGVVRDAALAAMER